MQITIRQTETILKANFRFSMLGFSMLITRLKGLYAANPSQEVLESSTEEINAFLDKFKGIMNADCEFLKRI